MDRRSLLRLGGAAVLGGIGADAPPGGRHRDADDEEVWRGIEERTYRLVGRLPETDESS